MLFCLTLAVIADKHQSFMMNPCQGEFLSNFQANCSNTTQHFCNMNEWICVIHGDHYDDNGTLSGICLGNSYGCLLTVNRKTNQCFGHCVNQNQVVESNSILVLCIVLFIVVISVGCVVCCCGCGCYFLTGYMVQKWVKKRGTLNRGNGFFALPDGWNGQQLTPTMPMMPMMPMYPMPGGPIPAQGSQFVPPNPGQTEA
jgi:hypothetical protein